MRAFPLRHEKLHCLLLVYSSDFHQGSCGPFTVESLSPHRIVPADAEELIDVVDTADGKKKRGPLSSSETDFATMVIEHLKTAGVHQTDKADRIELTSLTPFPGRGYVGTEGRFMEGETERRAAIFIGPEFGTLSRVDLTAAAREAAESRFDLLIAVSFAFDAHASELTRLGPLPILKAKKALASLRGGQSDRPRVKPGAGLDGQEKHRQHERKRDDHLDR